LGAVEIEKLKHGDRDAYLNLLNNWVVPSFFGLRVFELIFLEPLKQLGVVVVCISWDENPKKSIFFIP